MNEMPKVLLIDGNNLAHMGRGSIMSHNNQRTEIIFMGLSMLSNNLKEFEPYKVGIVWDGGLDCRRTEICPEYKEGRRKPRTEAEEKEIQEFYAQMREFKKVLSAFGIAQFEVKGREADDVIWNLVNEIDVRTYRMSNFVVMSTDKDFFQLLGLFPSLVVWNPVKKSMWTRTRFEAEFGFPCQYYLDYKAMVGDPSDSLKGVPGIGEKNARMLIEKVFLVSDGSRNIQLTKKEERYARLLHEGFSELERMRRVMEFYDISIDEIREGVVDRQTTTIPQLHKSAIEILNRYGFERFLKRFQDFIYPFERLLTEKV